MASGSYEEESRKPRSIQRLDSIGPALITSEHQTLTVCFGMPWDIQEVRQMGLLIPGWDSEHTALSPTTLLAPQSFLDP